MPVQITALPSWVRKVALAIWLGNIIDLLEPEVIVLGGGLGHLMTSFLSVIRVTPSIGE